MVKQWAQPPINKHRLPPGGFLLGPHLTSFFLYIYNYIYKVFIGISGEKFEIHFVAIGYIDFEKGFK
jgi:hypothetical protein